jgi:hypothetical protein
VNRSHHTATIIQNHNIHIGRSRIFGGKCENSAKNWPDYVKITPQNSTDYVKSSRKFIPICDLQIANLDSNIIGNYEKVTPILIFS